MEGKLTLNEKEEMVVMNGVEKGKLKMQEADKASPSAVSPAVCGETQSLG